MAHGDASEATASAGSRPSIGKGGSESSIDSSLPRQIEMLRRNLLDIGTRNRLISAPLKSARANVLEIIDEKADQIFSSLWRANSAFTFAHNETAQPQSSLGAGEEVADDLS